MKLIKVAKELGISFRTVITIMNELNIPCEYRPTAQIDEHTFTQVKSFLIENPEIIIDKEINDVDTTPKKGIERSKPANAPISITSSHTEEKKEKDAEKWTQQQRFVCTICKNDVKFEKYKSHLLTSHFSSIKENWEKFPSTNEYFLTIEIEFVKSVLIGRSIDELSALFEIPGSFLIEYIGKKSRIKNPTNHVLTTRDFEACIDMFMTLKYLSKKIIAKPADDQIFKNNRSQRPAKKSKKRINTHTGKNKNAKWSQKGLDEKNNGPKVKVIEFKKLDPKVREIMERVKDKNPINLPKGRDRKIPEGAYLNKYGDGFWIVKKR